MKKKVILIISVCLLAVFSACMFGCDGTAPVFRELLGLETETETGLQPHSVGAVYSYGSFKPEKDKAILFLPGLMASAFYTDDAAHTEMWGYGRFGSIISDLIKVGGNKNATTAEKHQLLDNIVNSIACDENQAPYTVYRIANMDDDLAYDSFGGMGYGYRMLEPVYGDDYDMVVWQYDWRQHNEGAADELEKFINNCGYKEICFITHSMGGTVVANYLAKSAENREKVKLFIPFGAPFFGSMDAVTNLFQWQRESDEPIKIEDINVTAAISGLINGTDMGVGLIDFGVALINYLLESDYELTDLTRNIATVYQMLPTTALSKTAFFDPTSKDYVGSTAPLTANGTALTTDALLTDYLCGLGWTHREDGSLKPVVKALQSYFEKFFIDDGNGNKVFVSELVPTEYIVGIGIETRIGIEINENGKISKTYTSMLGDSTVPAYSASAGLPLDHERVHLVDGIMHGPLANDDKNNPADKTGLKYLLGICENYL